MAGILPVITASVRLSAPAAPATRRRFPMLVTDDAASVPRPALVRLSMSIFVPAAGRVRLPTRPRKPNPAGPPEPAAGVWVTVMSVPTPYSECSTVAWASLTPADAAVTVMTKPIPRARPRAIKTRLAYPPAQLTPQIGEEHENSSGKCPHHHTGRC